MFKVSFYPKRYFRVCFRSARVIIKNDKDDEKSARTILFRDILDVEDTSKADDKRSKSQSSFLNFNISSKKLTSSQFTLTTSNKQYRLIAANPMEKQMWIDAFRYIIPSAKILQDLMKENAGREK